VAGVNDGAPGAGRPALTDDGDTCEPLSPRLGSFWRPWAAGELRSRPIHSGHHQAEQAPDELAIALLDFLRRPGSRQAA
jgi:hypothetical protein